MSKFSVTVESFKKFRSHTLLGFVDITINELRLRIRELTVHQSHGHRWVGLPGKPQIDRDGMARRNEKGKVAYTPVLQFLDRETSDAFSRRVVEELVERFPGVFDGVVT